MGYSVWYYGLQVVLVLAFLAVAYWLKPPRVGGQAASVPGVAKGMPPGTSWLRSLLWLMLLAVVFSELPVPLSVPLEVIRDLVTSPPNDHGAHVMPRLYWIYYPLTAFLVGFVYIERAPRIRGAVIPVLAHELVPWVNFCFRPWQWHMAALHPRIAAKALGVCTLRALVYMALALFGAWVWTRIRERPKANEVSA